MCLAVRKECLSIKYRTNAPQTISGIYICDAIVYFNSMRNIRFIYEGYYCRARGRLRLKPRFSEYRKKCGIVEGFFVAKT